MIQATSIGMTASEQAEQGSSQDSPLKAFLFCTFLGAVIGPFVLHQQVAPTVEAMTLPLILMITFIGASTGGITGLLVATMWDVIVGGRLEEE